MVLARTGTIAINVEGKIIHSLLKVLIWFKYFTYLVSEAAKNLQLSVDAVSFLIINEFAMIDCHLMNNLKLNAWKLNQIAFILLMKRPKAIQLPAKFE